MIESVFIILPAEENACIFFGQLDESAEEIDDLGAVLGTIVDYASNLGNNQGKSIQLGQGKFVYGKFDDIYLIFKINSDADMNDVRRSLKNVAKGFLTKYKDDLSSFSGDISVFESFSENIPVFLSGGKSNTISETEKIEQKTSEIIKKEEGKSEGKGVGLLKKPKAIEFVPEEMPEVGKLKDDKPIIKPMKRESYPNGIEDWKKDEIHWNESQDVMKEYTAEFYEGLVAKLQIFFSISIVHHYEIIIDFQNYPEKPILSGTGALEGKLEENSYFMKHWDSKIPPHIIELVREFEAILMRLKSEGDLDPTSEMPENMMPELEPLEKLPPLPKSTPKPQVQESQSEIKVEIPVEKKDLVEEEIKTEKSIEPKTIQEPKPLKKKSKKEIEKEAKLKQKEEERMKKEKEKVAKKRLKQEKKDEKKRLKEILKEGMDDAEKELKGL